MLLSLFSYILSKKKFSYVEFFKNSSGLLLLQNADAVLWRAAVFYNRDLNKIHRKTSVLESLSQQSSNLKACNFIKTETLAQLFFCDF